MNSRALKATVYVIGLSSFFFVFRYALTQDNAFFDLKRVADKPPPDVEKILGQPSKLEGGARYVTIWIQKLGGRYQDYSYPKDAWTLLRDLGLDQNATADVSNHVTTRWRNVSGIYEVNVFPTAGKKIWYLHVLTNRRYE